MDLPQLPVSPAIASLTEALAERTDAVLIAPPGAGKTTIVPLALLGAKWLRSRKIVVLEPRRLATRAAAQRMAYLLAEPVGAAVGYRIRGDTRVGKTTRIEVVTEGVLTRMLQSDPTLEGVGLVVFDEFHERSLHADLGLTLSLQAKRLFRDDLRILVMSATLDASPVAAALGGAPVIEAQGRSYPVDVRYRRRSVSGPIEGAVAAQVSAALRESPDEETLGGGADSPSEEHGDDGNERGDVLVFLPGAAEIERTAGLLAERSLPAHIDLHPLYGNLPRQAQDRAIAPSPRGRRKIVLATAIAQTSLTIEGVRMVVDSGLMRLPRFNPATGMTGLETLRVTADVAEQRSGRAGRTAPGVCYRLWTAGEQRGLVPHLRPEILDADLAPLVLELALWGQAPDELTWFDPPPAPALAQAQELLCDLGALSPEGGITERGRKMAAIGLHPRLARMLVGAAETGRGALASDLAVLLGGRDPWRARGGAPDADIRLRIESLRRARAAGSLSGRSGISAGLRRVLEEAGELRRAVGVGDDVDVAPDEIEAAGELLALAYPDRIGRRRVGHDPALGASSPAADGRGARYLLRNGRGAELADGQSLGAHEWLVASELVDRGREARIYLGAPIHASTIEEIFADHVEEVDEVTWNPLDQRVEAIRRRRLGALVLADSPLPSPDPQLIRSVLLDGIQAAGLRVLPWDKKTRQLCERLRFMHVADPETWPDVSEAALLASLPDWLGPFLSGMRRLDDLSRLNLTTVLWTHVGWQHRSSLDELAPTHLEVPSGSRIPLDYSDPAAPALAVRLQEVFGWNETPRVGGDRVAVTMRLLSPAQRPVQVTTDLASFWRGTYFEVRKDLKGRYPKHHWPDDPLNAEPTRRTRR